MPSVGFASERSCLLLETVSPVLAVTLPECYPGVLDMIRLNDSCLYVIADAHAKTGETNRTCYRIDEKRNHTWC